MPLPSGRTAETLGTLLTRVIVPLWVLSGALAKLWAASPKLLPKNIWSNALDSGINLYWLLFVLIALELFAVAVMVLLPRVARWMALWMLGVFCLVLIGEILAGNAKCGCLGSFSPPPWIMLAIDGALLLGVLLFRPRSEGGWFPRARLVATVAATVLGFVVSAAIILPQNQPTEVVKDGATSGGPAGPTYYALQDADSWVGQSFLETPLAGYIQDWPAEVVSGPHYLVFFSRSCDHCQMLLETHFGGPPAVPTTLVAIPESKAGFNPDAWLDMAYCADCVGELELPVGVDWLITPPLVIAVADGQVMCVKEADDADAPECLIFG